MYFCYSYSFDFRTMSNVEGPVETWMTAAEDEMHVSLRDITKEGVFVYAQHQRTAWLKLVLGMVGLVGSQIWYSTLDPSTSLTILLVLNERASASTGGRGRWRTPSAKWLEATSMP